MWGSSMMGWHGTGIWWALATAFFWIVIVALLIFAIAGSLKWAGLLHSTSKDHEDSAMAILKARFAIGEITTEQFDQMRRKLEGREDSVDRR